MEEVGLRCDVLGSTAMTCVHVLELPYPPLSGNNQTAAAANGGRYTKKEVLAYRRLVSLAAHEQGMHGLELEGPLELAIAAAPPNRRRRDADNFLKPLLDAITRARVWLDDSNQVIARTEIEWCDPEPGGRVLLTIIDKSAYARDE